MSQVKSKCLTRHVRFELKRTNMGRDRVTVPCSYACSAMSDSTSGRKLPNCTVYNAPVARFGCFFFGQGARGQGPSSRKRRTFATVKCGISSACLFLGPSKGQESPVSSAKKRSGYDCFAFCVAENCLQRTDDDDRGEARKKRRLADSLTRLSSSRGTAKWGSRVFCRENFSPFTEPTVLEYSTRRSSEPDCFWRARRP